MRPVYANKRPAYAAVRTTNAMRLKAVIRNRAKEEGVPAQLVMQNYLLERLLERISLSPWRDCVVSSHGFLLYKPR